MYSWYTRLPSFGSKSLLGMSTQTERVVCRKSSGRWGQGIKLNHVNFTSGLPCWADYEDPIDSRRAAPDPRRSAPGIIDPPEEFRDLPGAVVMAPILGFFSGTALGVYRLPMASVDIAFTPFWVFPTLSPEPRYEIIKGVEYD